MADTDIKTIIADYVKTASEAVTIAHDLIFGTDEEVMKTAAAVGKNLVNTGYVAPEDLEDTVSALADHKQALRILDNVLRKQAGKESSLGRPYAAEQKTGRPRFIGDRVYGEPTEADRALMRHLFGEAVV